MNLIIKDSQAINLKGTDLLYIESGNTEEIVVDIKVAKNSNILIVEKDLSNITINLNIEENSNVKYQNISTNISKVKRNLNIDTNSSVEFVQISINEVENDATVDLIGENANVNMKYLCIAKNINQEINCTINHKAKYTFSIINNIGVSFDNAKINFNTVGKIENGYSKCNCSQLSKGIIVGEKSKIITRPILLIDEYDVKAYHGASIGKMSDDELFYLMSRGLSKTDAFLLILSGLIDPVLKTIINEELKQEISNKINELIG